MKLGQNQVFKQGEGYLRVVQLDRLAVQYKAVSNLLTGEGVHHQVSKKAFCRLIKGATLLTQDEVREIWKQSPTSFDELESPGQDSEGSGEDLSSPGGKE